MLHCGERGTQASHERVHTARGGGYRERRESDKLNRTNGEDAVTGIDPSLSARERLALLLSRSPTRRRLVALLLEGKSRKAIALEMQRSQHTIDSHLKAIYATIGCGDRARLMMMVHELLSAPPPPGSGDWYAVE